MRQGLASIIAVLTMAVGLAQAATLTVRDMLTAARHLQQRQLEDDRRYEQFVGTLNIGQWMSVQAVLDKSLRTRYRAEVARAQDALRTYREESATVRAQLKRYAEDVSRMGPEGEAFKRGFDSRSGTGDKLTQDSIANETAIYALVARFYAFLDDPRTRYQIGQSRITFDSDEDLKRYKAYFQELKVLAKRSDELQAEALKRQAEANEKLKAFEKTLPPGK